MIRASAAAAGERLVLRLRARAERLIAARAAARRRRKGSDWHSAAALWPDLFGDDARGK